MAAFWFKKTNPSILVRKIKLELLLFIFELFFNIANGGRQQERHR
jgi:hypothetical protein